MGTIEILCFGLEPEVQNLIAAPGLIFMVPGLMARTDLVPRKRRGPAPNGKSTQIQVRLQPDQFAGLDAWIEAHKIKPTRPGASRGMIDAALHIPAKDPARSPGQKAKVK